MMMKLLSSRLFSPKSIDRQLNSVRTIKSSTHPNRQILEYKRNDYLTLTMTPHQDAKVGFLDRVFTTISCLLTRCLVYLVLSQQWAIHRWDVAQPACRSKPSTNDGKTFLPSSSTTTKTAMTTQKKKTIVLNFRVKRIHPRIWKWKNSILFLQLDYSSWIPIVGENVNLVFFGPRAHSFTVLSVKTFAVITSHRINSQYVFYV